jgi:hypothetical protein
VLFKILSDIHLYALCFKHVRIGSIIRNFAYFEPVFCICAMVGDDIHTFKLFVDALVDALFS